MYLVNAYNIDWWGNGYFSVNEKGHVTVNPTKSEQTSVNQVIDLSELVNERLEKDKNFPRCSVSRKFCKADFMILTKPLKMPVKSMVTLKTTS